MPNPSISVVIPAFNAERFLGEAIESVLSQTHQPAEVIVVDDGSADGTGAIASSYSEVELVTLDPNRGPAAARNFGYQACGGDLITFHDADDVMLPEKLAIQIDCLQTNREAGVVVGVQQLFREEGSELPFWLEGSDASKKMFVGRPPSGPANIHAMTMLVRRDVFERVGPFDPEIGFAEDLDWMFRASELGVEIVRLEQVLIRRRIHEGGVTQDLEACRVATIRAFKARIDRARAR